MPYQFTSHDFTSMLLKAEIAISMDARGSWRGNVFVERRWRSIKYEEVYLRAARGRTLLSMAHAAVRANQATSQRCLEREHPRFVPLWPGLISLGVVWEGLAGGGREAPPERGAGRGGSPPVFG